jgi:ABC-type multidrug transport system fused ATPase/permease subunit
VSRPSALGELVAFSKRRASLCAVALLCMAIMIGAMVLLPPWVSHVVRDEIPRRDTAHLARALAVGVALVLAVTSAMFGRDYALMRLATELAADVRLRLARAALYVPWPDLRSERWSSVLARASNDVAALQHAMVRGLAVFVPNAIVTVVLLLAMLRTSWPLALGTAVLVAPMLLLVRFFGRNFQFAVRESQERVRETLMLLRDAIDGGREIRAFGRESLIEQRMMALHTRGVAAAAREERLAALHPAAATFLGIAGLAGLVLVAAALHARGTVGTSELISFLVFLGMLVGPLQETARSAGAVTRFATLFDGCLDLVHSRDRIETHEEGAALPRLEGAIEVENLAVAFAQTGFTLGPLSFRIHAGECVAIIGESGAGKSTLLDVLVRLREPDQGTIAVDGHDIVRFRRDSLRTQAALLTQEPFLFPGTIEENIRFGRVDATESAIREVARAAHVDEFVARLPSGLGTQLDRGGANLSVGQRQRIALARALLRDPAILLLDEPTSALDAESERLLVDSLQRFRRGRTVLVVTHRPALLALADRVLTIREGRLVSPNDSWDAAVRTKRQLEPTRA